MQNVVITLKIVMVLVVALIMTAVVFYLANAIRLEADSHPVQSAVRTD